MYYDSLMVLMGKKVDVKAQGITFSGTLIEVTDEAVFLQSELGWIEVRVEDVTEIKAAE